MTSGCQPFSPRFVQVEVDQLILLGKGWGIEISEFHWVQPLRVLDPAKDEFIFPRDTTHNYASQVGHEKNPLRYFPLYWLFNRDPYNSLL